MVRQQKPVEKTEKKAPVSYTPWWNERHLAVLFIVLLGVTLAYNGL